MRSETERNNDKKINSTQLNGGPPTGGYKRKEALSLKILPLFQV